MTAISRPGTAVNNQWATNTVTLIDNPVIAPSSAGDGDFVKADHKDDNKEQIYGGFIPDAVASLSEIYTLINSITVHTRCRDDDGFDTTLDKRLLINGVWTSVQQINYGTLGPFGWFSATFAGAWDPLHVDAVQCGLRVGSNPELQMAVLYLEHDGNLRASAGAAVTSGTSLSVSPRL